MTIYETIQRDKLKSGANRALLSLIQGEICIDGKSMDDSSAIIRLAQMSKTCDKNMKIYHDRGQMNPYFEEVDFQKIIKSYMPDGAVEQDIESAIIDLGVEKNMKSMGRVMGYLKGKFQVVDGNLVKSILTGGK